MKEDKNYYIVDKDVLPEIFTKVMEVKGLLESGFAQTVQEAVAKVGISRSAFYKYKDSIHPLYENSRGRNVTIAVNLVDKSGLLSLVLNSIANAGANILTINQTIPINGIANVVITIETYAMESDLGSLIESVKSLKGVQTFNIIARE